MSSMSSRPTPPSGAPVADPSTAGRGHAAPAKTPSKGAAPSQKRPGDSAGRDPNALTTMELRSLTRVPVSDTDIGWAGRLIGVAPVWWPRTTMLSVALLSVSIAALLAMWVSIVLRHPPLLVGVYPDGSEVCFPRLVTPQGRVVPRNPAYNAACDSLNARTGLMWQTDLNNLQSSADAIASSAPLPAYMTPDDVLAGGHAPSSDNQVQANQVQAIASSPDPQQPVPQPPTAAAAAHP